MLMKSPVSVTVFGRYFTLASICLRKLLPTIVHIISVAHLKVIGNNDKDDIFNTYWHIMLVGEE